MLGVFWLTQKAMAELFDCTTDNISLHLKNIYADGELNESSTTEEFSIVQQEGSRKVKRKIKFYNLDDDERLKQGKTAFGKDYFRELLNFVFLVLQT